MNLPTPFETFIEMLIENYESKKKINPSFSRRAYARYLGIANSPLANLMKKRIVEDATLIRKLGEKIHLSDNEIQYFTLLAKVKRIKDEQGKLECLNQAMNVPTRFNIVNEQDSSILESWYTLAVMEVIKRQDAVLTPEWIAEKLNISSLEAKGALELLIKNEIIKIDEGSLVILKDFINIPIRKNSSAWQTFKKQ